MEIIRNTPSNTPRADDLLAIRSSSRPSKLSPTSPSTLTFCITRISPAVKNENRVNIFINNEYSFSLDIAQLADFKLKKGQILTEEQIAEYKNASEFGKLYQSALEWALARPRSVKETRDYLRRKQLRRTSEAKKYQHSQEYLHSAEFFELDQAHRQAIYKRQPRRPAPTIDDRTIEKILARLTDKGYVSDQHFAEYYIEFRHQKQGISLKKLRLELIKKGLDHATIEQALAKVPRDDTAEIQKIIAKKRRHYDTEEKLIQYLLRQGFPYELAKTAVRETDSQSSE